MLNHKNIYLTILFVTTLLHFDIAWSDPDMQGSKDHTEIPRVTGTTIIGFAESGYDEGVFMTGELGKELLSETVEGKRTRIMYVGPKDLSPLGALRNYQKAFNNLGEVEEIYTCKSNDCFSNLGKIFVWREANRLPTNLGKDSGNVTSFGGFKNQIYWYGKVKAAESYYSVSVYSAIITFDEAWRKLYGIKRIQDHPVINLEIVEVVDFNPALEVITAEDMATNISEKGHIALYGIYFDFDSDLLKPESDPALEEIAKVLKAETALNIYVVGHTDNKGRLEYTEDLSKRRAGAVVDKLTSKYGIASDRMAPVGVGPAAPVTSNKTEEGRALNRRVELVER